SACCATTNAESPSRTMSTLPLTSSVGSVRAPTGAANPAPSATATAAATGRNPRCAARPRGRTPLCLRRICDMPCTAWIPATVLVKEARLVIPLKPRPSGDVADRPHIDGELDAVARMLVGHHQIAAALVLVGHAITVDDLLGVAAAHDLAALDDDVAIPL